MDGPWQCFTENFSILKFNAYSELKVRITSGSLRVISDQIRHFSRKFNVFSINFNVSCQFVL